MTVAIAALDEAPSLFFSRSESQAVGLIGSIKKFVENNAPRIVAALKLAGDVAVGLSMNPWLLGYMAFSGTGRILMLIYGTKANQQKVAAEHANEAPHKANFLEKIMHPSQYPVEASAGLSTVGESMGVGFGVSRFLAGATGFTSVILGAFAVWSYANILLGKEKKPQAAQSIEPQDALNFQQSSSQPVGFIGRIRQKMKDNPVLVSSLLLFTINTGLLIGGIAEGYGAAYIVGASILLAANLIQTLFVRKNEFNIEGAQAEQKAATFADRVTQPPAEPGLQRT